MDSSMTIGKKLVLCFGAMLALVLGMGYSSLSSVGTLSTELDSAVNKTARKTELAAQIETAYPTCGWDKEASYCSAC
jgi:hypothetical protein